METCVVNLVEPVDKMLVCAAGLFGQRMKAGRSSWQRLYHHTAPINMNYALHEALRIVLEEGLEARWERHALHSRALKRGLRRSTYVTWPILRMDTPPTVYLAVHRSGPI